MLNLEIIFNLDSKLQSYNETKNNHNEKDPDRSRRTAYFSSYIRTI